MCKVPTGGEFADPLGVTRGGKAAPGAKELMDPAGFTEAILQGERPRGYDPAGISAGWKSMTGQTALEQARDAQLREQQASAARQRLAEEERQKAARMLARSSITRRTGRASTLLTGPSGLITNGTTARRELLPG